jgi:hypothetical protein
LEKWGLEIDDVHIVGRKMFEKGNENEESNDVIDGVDGNWEMFENICLAMKNEWRVEE